MNNLIAFLADNQNETFYLTEDEEKELLETIPNYLDEKLEHDLLRW